MTQERVDELHQLDFFRDHADRSHKNNTSDDDDSETSDGDSSASTETCDDSD